MNKKEMMVKAHKMTKEIKAQYPDVDYKFQLGLCMPYFLNNKEDIEMVEDFKTFKVWGKLSGREGLITIGKIEETCGVHLYVKRLTMGNDTIVSDKLPPVKASVQHRASRTKVYKYPFLAIKLDGKIKVLELNNYKLIEYIWKKTGKGWDSIMYKYTDDYIANWCD